MLEDGDLKTSGVLITKRICQKVSLRPRALLFSFNRVLSTYILWASQGNTGDIWNADKAELGDEGASLLLVAVVDNGGLAGWHDLSLGLRVRVVLDLLDLLWGLLLVDLLDAWVGHFCGCLCILLAVVAQSPSFSRVGWILKFAIVGRILLVT